MTIHTPDPEVPAATPVPTGPRLGWPVLLLCLAALVAIIAVPLSVVSLVRNRNLATQIRAAEQAIVAAEATRVAQPAALEADLDQVRAQLAPALAGWPSEVEAAQVLNNLSGLAAESGAELIALQPLESGGAAPSVVVPLRYRVQMRGPWASVLSFVSRIARTLPTLRIENLSIPFGSPALARAELTLYATAADAWTMPAPTAQPTTEPGATPALDSAVLAEILRLETMMRAAQTMRAWPAYVGYGERILELDPGRSSAIRMLYDGHVLWAQELLAQGDRAGARTHFTEALRLLPAGAEALDGLIALDSATAVPTMAPTSEPPTPAPTPTTVVYRVRPGDTLSGIAARYRITVAELMQANNLRSTTIYVDQRLVIPTR
ncbi:MAG: type 4a pilus biogenesis protein PilO [Chloroflexi bacterium]|nr:type 4a pilus biogenesis protein PilO [Chloroflexota bacterium]